MTTAFDLFPLDPGKKAPPIPGVTGIKGDSTWRPEWADHQGNWGARLRPGYIGLDIDGADHAAGKEGPQSIEAPESDIGTLPLTTYSTRHGADSETRIALFRIPEGIVLSEKPLAGVEIIQHHHRYIACAPSVVDDKAYCWYDFLGEIDEPVDIADLPDAWVEYLRSEARGDSKIATSDEVQGWLSGLPEGDHGDKTQRAIEAASARGGNDSELLWKVTRVLRAIEDDGTHDAVEILHDMLEGDYIAAGYPQSAWHRQWRRALEKVVGAILEDRVPDNGIDPEALWTCGRPEIEHVMTVARGTLHSPWALLSALLTRTACSVPYWVLPTTFMGGRSLNLLTALSGGTGMGKTAADEAVDENWVFGVTLPEMKEAGSGEAIATAYAYVARKDDDENGIKAGSLIWKHEDHAARFVFDEIGKMNAMQSRQGATVIEYMKSAESGAALGRELASGQGVTIPGKEYRFTAQLNVQPARAHLILSPDEVAGGFPGRLLWADTRYAPFAKMRRSRAALKPVKVSPVHWTRGDKIKALPVIEDAVEAQRHAGHAEDLDPMESHATFLRFKVAALLAVLASRKELNDEDWELAGLIMEHSRRTRAAVLGEVEAVAYSARATGGVKAERIITKVAEMQEAGLTMGEAKRKLAGRDRPTFDALVKSGEIHAW